MKSQIKFLLVFVLILGITIFEGKYLKSEAATACIDVTCNTSTDCNNHGTCYSARSANAYCYCGQDASGYYYGGKLCDQIICDCACNPPDSQCITKDSNFGPAGCLAKGHLVPAPYFSNFPTHTCPPPTRTTENISVQKILNREISGTWLGEIPPFSENELNEHILIKICVKGPNELEAVANSDGLFNHSVYHSHIVSDQNAFFLSFKNSFGDVVQPLIQLTGKGASTRLSVRLSDGRTFQMKKIDKFKDCAAAIKKGINSIPQDFFKY